MYCLKSPRFMMASLVILTAAAVLPGQAIAKTSRRFNIPRLVGMEVEQVEKTTGHPTHINKSNDDVGWVLREYTLSFGAVKIDYFEGKAASFTIVLKSPEHSATALTRRFGINVARRKPAHADRHSRTWSGGFANRAINEVHVESSHDDAWDTLEVKDYSSVNE